MKLSKIMPNWADVRSRSEHRIETTNGRTFVLLVLLSLLLSQRGLKLFAAARTGTSL